MIFVIIAQKFHIYFASMLNIAKTTLNGYIKSNHEPDFETVKAMAGALHISTDCLLLYSYFFFIIYNYPDTNFTI